MGARTALAMALAAPQRVSNLILGGVGSKLREPSPPVTGNPMAEAMLADDPASIAQPMLQSFRQFADEQGEDRKALAAFTQVKNPRSEEHTSELQSLMRISYAVFCLKKQNKKKTIQS